MLFLQLFMWMDAAPKKFPCLDKVWLVKVSSNCFICCLNSLIWKQHFQLWSNKFSWWLVWQMHAHTSSCHFLMQSSCFGSHKMRFFACRTLLSFPTFCCNCKNVHGEHENLRFTWWPKLCQKWSMPWQSEVTLDDANAMTTISVKTKLTCFRHAPKQFHVSFRSPRKSCQEKTFKSDAIVQQSAKCEVDRFHCTGRRSTWPLNLLRSVNTWVQGTFLRCKKNEISSWKKPFVTSRAIQSRRVKIRPQNGRKTFSFLLVESNTSGAGWWNQKKHCSGQECKIQSTLPPSETNNSVGDSNDPMRTKNSMPSRRSEKVETKDWTRSCLRFGLTSVGVPPVPTSTRRNYRSQRTTRLTPRIRTPVAPKEWYAVL